MKNLIIISVVIILLYFFLSSDEEKINLTKEHVHEAIGLATAIKQKVNHYYEEYNNLPSSNSELNIPPPREIISKSVASIRVSHGVILITLKENIINGRHIKLQPAPIAMYPRELEWACSSNDIATSFFEDISPPCLYTPSQVLDDLFRGIHTKDIEAVQYAINDGIDLNRTLHGIPPLILAIERSTLEIVKLLIDSGADISQTSHYSGNTSPLIFAIKKNKPEMVKLLIEAGADVNNTDKKGKNALWYAREYRRSIAQYLIDNGADEPDAY